MGDKTVIKGSSQAWRKRQEIAQRASDWSLLGALTKHDIECVKYALFALRADPNTKIDPWRPALHAAVAFLEPEQPDDVKAVAECLRLLLDNEAQIDMRSEHGETALCHAIEHGSVPIVEQLLDAGASIVGIDGNKNIVEYVLSQKYQDPELVRMLRTRYAEMFMDWWAAGGGAGLGGV